MFAEHDILHRDGIVNGRRTWPAGTSKVSTEQTRSALIGDVGGRMPAEDAIEGQLHI